MSALTFLVTLSLEGDLKILLLLYSVSVIKFKIISKDKGVIKVRVLTLHKLHDKINANSKRAFKQLRGPITLLVGDVRE